MFFPFQSIDELNSDGDITKVYMSDPGAPPGEQQIYIDMLLQSFHDGTYRRHFVFSIQETGLAYQFQFR